MEPTLDNTTPTPPPKPGAVVMPAPPVAPEPATPPTQSLPVAPTPAPEAHSQPTVPVAAAVAPSIPSPEATEAAPLAAPPPAVIAEPVYIAEAATLPVNSPAVNEADADTIEYPSDGVSVEPDFQWQASEYVQHHKGTGWYAGLAVAVLVLLGIAILTQQWLSIAVFAVMGVALVVYAHKPPRVLLYQLDGSGIVIEGKSYDYSQFRSFAVLQDDSWHAIDLEPTQRFMPRLTIIFSSEDLDGIVSHLALHLPRADRQPDMVERLTRYLRF